MASVRDKRVSNALKVQTTSTRTSIKMLSQIIVHDSHSQGALQRNMHAHLFTDAARQRTHTDDNHFQTSDAGVMMVCSPSACAQCPADKRPRAASKFKFADMYVGNFCVFWARVNWVRVGNVSAERFPDEPGTCIQGDISTLKFPLRRS